MAEEKFLKLLNAVRKQETNSECLSTVLKHLKEFEVTPELLEKTRGIQELKKLARNEKIETSRAAKEAIKQWKNRAQRIFEERHQEKLKKIPKTKSETLSGDGSSMEIGGGGGSTSLIRLGSVDSKGLEMTGDKIRDTVRQKFASFLEQEESTMKEKMMDSNEAACVIEKAIFDLHRNPNGPDYKQKFRTLMFNLKDPKNGPLRQRILNCQILPDQLVRLSTEDLANEEKKKENNTIREKQLRECERGKVHQATTDAFTCGKCRQSKCSYYQIQTRSADEPMTVYVTCANCNNRWKS